MPDGLRATAAGGGVAIIMDGKRWAGPVAARAAGAGGRGRSRGIAYRGKWLMGSGRDDSRTLEIVALRGKMMKILVKTSPGR